MAVVALIFSIMSYFYTYVYYGSSRNDGENEPLIDGNDISLSEVKNDNDEDDEKVSFVGESRQKEDEI